MKKTPIFILITMLALTCQVNAGTLKDLYDKACNKREYIELTNGAYRLPLGVDLAEFISWCEVNKAIINNELLEGQRKELEGIIKRGLIDGLVGFSNIIGGTSKEAKEADREAKKIAGYKWPELLGLLAKLEQGEKVPFHFEKMDLSYFKEKIAAFNGLPVFTCGSQKYIFENIYFDASGAAKYYLEKYSDVKIKDENGNEEFRADVFQASLQNGRKLIKAFTNRYAIHLTLAMDEAKGNGLKNVDVLFWRDDNGRFKSYQAVYHYNPEYLELLTKNLDEKYGKSEISEEQSSEDQSLNAAFLEISGSKWATDIRYWRKNIYMRQTGELDLVYFENKLGERIIKDIEEDIMVLRENYKKELEKREKNLKNNF